MTQRRAPGVPERVRLAGWDDQRRAGAQRKAFAIDLALTGALEEEDHFLVRMLVWARAVARLPFRRRHRQCGRAGRSIHDELPLDSWGHLVDGTVFASN